ncbi:Protoheme IX farnesyltransferase 2 [Planctomycetes bacterium Pan216]|uniref:Protoheme IX farnesyltransferase n=1 Tax=Kolteria novifilia TaxID=2527975 RepID=A0A518B7Z5_9BACT|nr:Protoheme IX farnesyltransferase 2 [Planctomycetes bacterium Pan216]
MSIDPAMVADRSALGLRLADYASMTKPRIAVMVLVTVAVGGFLATGGAPDSATLLSAIIGTGLVAAGASVMNQWLERESDALMRRTALRPIPAGRVSPAEAFALGTGLGLFGTLFLATTVNWLTALLAVVCYLLYVVAYTPLKRYSSLNTAVGAIPGALPAVIGWTAMTGQLDPRAWILFLILFLWQFPHFFAIAWLYRSDYAGAGLKMLPTTEAGQRVTGVQAVAYALALLPISLAPTLFGLTGTLYFWAALACGIHYLAYSVAFMMRQCDQRARQLMWASLVYLPSVMALLMLDLVQGA